MGVTREDIILQIKTTGGEAFQRSMTGMNRTMKKMKFEWLGIMFAGMALTRVFGGLVKAQLDLFGVSEMMSAAWTIVLLPVMELLVPVLMTLIDLFMNLPEGMQLVIGIFILIGFIIGIVMMVVGQLVLAISAFAIATGASVGLVLAAFALIVLVLFGIGLIFFGLLSLIQNLGKNWSKVFRAMGLIALGVAIILIAFVGWFPALIAVIVAGLFFLLSWIATKFPKVGEFFRKWFFEKPKEWVGKLWDYIKGFFSWIGSKFSGVFGFFGGLFGKGGGGVLGSFQTGGIVPQTGPYILHAGETVVPTGQPGFNGGGASPSITINANISSDYDVRRMADQLKRYWVSDFDRASKGRTI